MQIRMAVTGDQNFFAQKRMSLLFDTLQELGVDLDRVPIDNVFDSKWLRATAKRILSRLPVPVRTTGRASGMRKSAGSYIKQSQRCELAIRNLGQKPDFVLHLFGMYCPFWEKFDIPFAMYLDYTMALARRTWEPWAPFAKKGDLQAWLDCEAIAYEKASCIFTFSNLVKRSLVEDYGVCGEKVIVVGAAGQFSKPYEGPKEFGSHRLLFNATNFERKGGDLVLSAFQKIRAACPTAELLIVGGDESAGSSPGVKQLGFVSGAGAMERLFLDCDILVAPARCEPYGQLLVEAANYGLPCIVSNRGGMKEIVEHDVSGIVLADLSVNALAEAVIGLLQDQTRLKRYSRAGRDKVKMDLNWISIGGKMHAEICKRLPGCTI